MPEDTTDKVLTPEEVAAHNAEIAAKQANQDAAGKSMAGTPGEFEESQTALDKMAAAISEKNKPIDEEGNTAAPVVEPKPADKPAVEPVPDADKVTAEEAARKLAEETEAKRKQLEEADAFFKDAPKLPPNASVKSSEAFSTVKIKAAQEISARDAKLKDLEAQLTAAKESQGKPDPKYAAIEAENKELRDWRSKIDVDFDPKFKFFDERASSARGVIYSMLKANPQVNDATIKQIEALGGPDRMDLESFFKALKDPALQRMVEGKVSEIHAINYEKGLALKSTKDNLQQYLKDREGEVSKGNEKQTLEASQALNEITGQMEWYKERAVTPGADEATKKQVEDHNKFVAQTRTEISEILKDNSPRTKAILIAGTMQLFQLRNDHASLEKNFKELEAKFKDINTKYESVKKASTTRLRETAAPATPAQIPEAKKDQFNVRAEDALDAMARQISEKRVAAGK